MILALWALNADVIQAVSMLHQLFSHSFIYRNSYIQTQQIQSHNTYFYVEQWMKLATYLAARRGRIPLAFGASYCYLGCSDPSYPWSVDPDSVAPRPGPRSTAARQTVGAS